MFDREVCPICGRRIHAEPIGEGERELAPHDLPRRGERRGRHFLCPGSGLVLPPVLILEDVAAGRGGESQCTPRAA